MDKKIVGKKDLKIKKSFPQAKISLATFQIKAF
jgi:hypothetical protein